MLMQRYMLFLNCLFFDFIAVLILFSQQLMKKKYLTEAQIRCRWESPRRKMAAASPRVTIPKAVSSVSMCAAGQVGAPVWRVAVVLNTKRRGRAGQNTRSSSNRGEKHEVVSLNEPISGLLKGTFCGIFWERKWPSGEREIQQKLRSHSLMGGGDLGR